MGAIIPETGTLIKVEVNTDNIDKSINIVNNNPIFAPVNDILNEIKTKIIDGAERVAESASEKLKNYQELWIIQNKSIDTSQMVSTIFIEPVSNLEYEVGATALSETGFPYPIVIEEGSNPYVIEGDPYLYWEGADHPVKRVHHPGIKARPFVAPALDNLEKDISKIAQIEITSKL